MKFGKGHLRDTPDERDYTAQHLFGTGPAADEVDLRPRLLRGLLNQLQTNACVAFAFALAIFLRAHILGIVIDFPSVLAIYAQARPEPLTDDGCYPRDAAKKLKSWGTCSEKRWPFDEKKVNEPLPLDVLEADVQVSGYYRLTGSGQELASQIRQALSAGYPVPFGQEVDDEFENYSGGVIGAWVGPSLGGHMSCLVGYRKAADGTYEYLGANSWGEDFGVDGGFYWISEARLLDARVTSDFYALTLQTQEAA